MKKLRTEAGDMIASSPGPFLSPPSMVDVVVRELEKLSDTGRLSPVEYSLAIDLARSQAKTLNYIYSGGANGLQRVIVFLLRQVRSR